MTRILRSFRIQHFTARHNNKTNQIPLYFDHLTLNQFYSFLSLYT
jgi:hypothetical protein